jgi:hypothetical protein
MAGGMMLEADDKKENKTISVNKKSTLFYRIVGMAAAVTMLFFTGKFLLEMNAETEPKIAVSSENADNIKKDGKKIKESVKASTNEKGNTKSGEKYSDQGNILIENAHSRTILENIFNKETIDHNRIVPGPVEKQNNLIPLAKKELPLYNISPSFSESSELKKKQDDGEIFNNYENKLPEKYAGTDKSKILGRHSKKWMLSMLTGNVSSNSSEQKFPGYTSMSGSPMTFNDFWITGTEPDPLTEVLLANQSKEVEARIRHKIPVTFGVSVYYNLGKKWGIGTGVNYTKLTSELHSGSNSNYIKGDQSIHYIGIPVQVNYNVIQKGRFTGYVTGGVLAEKAVAGKLKTKYIVNDEVQDEQEERLDVKPVQLSVNSAIGLQVKIIDKIGIYAEPGIGYHFKNDNQLNTIYKEKPLNFNMKFGIRLLLD